MPNQADAEYMVSQYFHGDDQNRQGAGEVNPQPPPAVRLEKGNTHT